MSYETQADDSVAAITGSAEPVYGEEAVHPITRTVTSKTALGTYTADDYRWIVPEWGSNVETQTFYVLAESGHICFAQIIHSNPSGLQYTAQFTCRVFSPTGERSWTSTTLEEWSTKEDGGKSFTAKGVSVRLNAENDTYHLKINVDPKTIVDFTVHRIGDGLKIGSDGYTHYGTDINAPWGSMRHLFWPRAEVNGVILLSGIPVDVKGSGCMIHALQGMKPHHAARNWNFCLFHGERTSAVMMEFTTPESYGSTKVNIGGLIIDGTLSAMVENEVVHESTVIDDETQWPRPTRFKFSWSGIHGDDPIEALLETGEIELLERVDVLAEIPPWLKKIAHGVSGTKPFIYQYSKKCTIKVNEIEETGTCFIESTFIS